MIRVSATPCIDPLHRPLALTPELSLYTEASDVYDRETHDRLAKAAFDWCEEVAKKFDAPAPNGAPTIGGSSASAAPTPIALSGEIQCTRSDATPPDGKVYYIASIDWRSELYQHAIVSALAPPIQSRIEFKVPIEGVSFKLLVSETQQGSAATWHDSASATQTVDMVSATLGTDPATRQQVCSPSHPHALLMLAVSRSPS